MEGIQGVKSVNGVRTRQEDDDFAVFTERIMETGRKPMEKNEIVIEFPANSRNESFARMAAAAFAAELDPTLEEIADIKTAVSEAVTNAILHGYDGTEGIVWMRMYASEDREIVIDVADQGIGMRNVLKAMEPMYTTRPELERSGMGFAFMESFMDELLVQSKCGVGTLVRMKKILSRREETGR